MPTSPTDRGADVTPWDMFGHTALYWARQRKRAAVVALLASSFNLPKSRLEITRGATARYKTIAYRA